MAETGTPAGSSVFASLAPLGSNGSTGRHPRPPEANFCPYRVFHILRAVSSLSMSLRRGRGRHCRVAHPIVSSWSFGGKTINCWRKRPWLLNAIARVAAANSLLVANHRVSKREPTDRTHGWWGRKGAGSTESEAEGHAVDDKTGVAYAERKQSAPCVCEKQSSHASNEASGLCWIDGVAS